ncbi:Prp18 domain-containing protein [Paraphysoderma sedebokerense]|nr:Prp18 domain-containing protein [Paraphysoderma sedebokerense]
MASHVSVTLWRCIFPEFGIPASFTFQTATMDILKAAIEAEKAKKRKILETSSSTSSSKSSDEPPVKKKYIKRSELEKIREQEYLESQRRLEEERRAKAMKNRTISSSSISSVNSHSSSSVAQSEPNGNADESEPITPEDDEDTARDIFNIPSDEVNKRFRARGQPIRLFGETDKQRIIRLRILEANSDKVEGGGQRNDFMKAVADTDARLTVDKKKQKLESMIYNPNYDTSQISPELLKVNPDRTYVLVYVYIKRLLHEWEEFLDTRPEHIKRSTQGKLDLAKVKQTGEYLKPFFKLLKRRALEQDVMERMVEIMHWMHQREYLKANDSYLRLSIGNAPWPIGVTMVGIHERSAREKIFSNQVAHVLNDESQRKWIQSVKRLMTFCQQKYPPDDLSKCVG